MIDYTFKANQLSLAKAAKRTMKAANIKPSQVPGVSAQVVRNVLRGQANPELYTISCIEQACGFPIIDFMENIEIELPKRVTDTINALETVLTVFEYVVQEYQLSKEDMANIGQLLAKARMMLLLNNLSYNQAFIEGQPEPTQHWRGDEQPDRSHEVDAVPEIRTIQDPEESTTFIQHS